MSSPEPKATTEKISTKKKYEGYDENLVLQSNEVTVEYEVFTDSASIQQVMTKLNEIGRFKDAANYLVRNEALREAKKSAGLSGGINRAVLMEFIKPYRELPQFASLITASDKRKATAEEWNAQTNAILAQIKVVPFIMNSIKDLSAKASTEDDE